MDTHKKLVSLGNFLFLWKQLLLERENLLGGKISRFIFYSWRSHTLFLLHWSSPGLQFPGL